MKKLIAVLLVVAIALGTVSCAGAGPSAGSSGPGQESSSSNAGGSADKEIPMDQTIALLLQEGGLGDEGWNDRSWAGMQECMQKYDINCITAEATGAADTELFLRELAQQGYGLIICLDTSIMRTLGTISADYPDTTFVVLSKIELMPNEGNLVKVFYQLNEHPFLAGVAAAFVATDGNEIVDYAGQNPGCKLGCIFPSESAGFYRYYDAFRHGALWQNPNAEFVVDYTTGFNDAALCQTIAENMITNQKCDVLWMCAGTSGLGGLQACRLHGALGIGVDMDQDNVEPGYVLTSVERRTEVDIKMIVDMWQAGTLRGSNPLVDLKSGGIGITDMSVIAEYVTNEAKFKELRALLEDVQKKIENKEIRPYDTAETAYAEDSEIVRFDEWWAENKDTNPNNIHDWTFEGAIEANSKK